MEDYCIKCGRCMAVCPSSALELQDFDINKFEQVLDSNDLPSHIMEAFLKSKRSCRSYQSRDVNKEELNKLLEVAQIAPTAVNSQEKSFIVITDNKKIEELKNFVLKESHKFKRLFNMLTTFPFKLIFPVDTRNHFIKLKRDYGALIDACENGTDHIFYNAPAVVLFTGIAMDSMGKDNALNAMNYFMLQAETMGLGSCINGFTSILGKKLERVIKIPKFHKVYGVITLGYRKDSFRRTIFRKDPEVRWY